MFFQCPEPACPILSTLLNVLDFCARFVCHAAAPPSFSLNKGHQPVGRAAHKRRMFGTC